MSEQLFDVVFFGMLQSGKNKETALENMAAMFKTDTNKLAPYFAGGRKGIKGNVNAETAEKYLLALENVGLVIKVEACAIEQDKTQTDVADNKTSSASTDKLNVVMNYLTGTGFRTGRIKHSCIQIIRTQISMERKKRKAKGE